MYAVLKKTRAMSKFYELVTKKVGAEVVGLDLQTENRPEGKYLSICWLTRLIQAVILSRYHVFLQLSMKSEGM